jgi:hypothetical protein
MLVRSLGLSAALVLAHLSASAAAGQGPEKAPAGDPPPIPNGIEVLARGPIHEAFAAPTAEPIPTKPVSKKPPKPLEELPPEEKPEGQVIWIGGYWAWDDERKDYLWVSGIWRTPPPNKLWIAGYWREQGDDWQWVPGFWTEAAEEEAKPVTYLPKPPDPPQVVPPGQPPAADSFYVPGSWIWIPAANTYAWRAGYWARVQPGYVWVPNHYRWTPSGYVFIPGYWDLTVSQRGVIYAPVIINPEVVTAGFYYTPAYAVSDTVVVDALFVRPMYAHYYFGDYYGPAYATMGFESVYVYSGRHYDSIIVYETWAHRSQPNWVSVQIDIFNGRSRGVMPVPPRTLVQQNTIIQQNITNVTNVTNVNNNVTNITKNTTTVNRSTVNYNAPVLATTSKAMAAKGVKIVPLDAATRVQAKQQAATVQQVAMQRTATEQPLPPGAPRQARVASLSVPKAQAVQPGFTAPHLTQQALNQAHAGQPLRPATAPPLSSIHPAGAPSSMAAAGARGMTAAPPLKAPGASPIVHPSAAGASPYGAHPGMMPAGANSRLQTPYGQPPRGVPNPAMSRPMGRPSEPPARRPPPKDPKEHHG